MKTRRFLTTLWVFTLAFNLAWAQGPNNSGTYYANANGKNGAALKTAMYNIIKKHDTKDYDNLTDYYPKTDKRADGYVRDWYSNATSYEFSQHTGTYNGEGDMYNKEHSFPSSWFKKASPMYSDIVHVVPADGYVNNRRQNYLLGKVGTVSWSSKNGYSKVGSCATTGYSGTVFEPNDEIKGDLARIYFYMVTCYQDKITSWTDNAIVSSILDGNIYPGYQQWYLDMLMEWSKYDPVDDVEIARNNAVKEVQDNRNPFVDYPGLEDYIWGDKKDVAFSYDNYDGSSLGKQNVTMAFSPTAVTITEGEAFMAPTLTTDPVGLMVTYSSSNTSVATVNSSTGAVSIKAAGTAIITASFAGNDEYYSGSASYTLTVKQQGGDNPTPSDGSFIKVTSVDQLVVGYEYIFVAESSKMVMNKDGSGKYFGNTSISISDNEIEYNDEMMVLTLGGSSGAWTFMNGTLYFVCNGEKNVSLSNNSSIWAINTNDFSVASGDLTLKYNTSSPRFTTYKPSSGGVVTAVLYYRNPNVSTTIPGDVVKDGELTFADLKALVKILLGIDASGDGEIDEDAADVNEDGEINIADVTKLVNILLSE